MDSLSPAGCQPLGSLWAAHLARPLRFLYELGRPASSALKCNQPGIGVNFPAAFTTSWAQMPPRKAQKGWSGVWK